MLTKDLVQATVRNGKLFPKFIKADDEQARSEAAELIDIFSDVTGRAAGEVEEDIKDSASGIRGKALAKLLMDRCVVNDPGDEIMNERWDLFAASERARFQGADTLKDFQLQIAREHACEFESIQARIFADLPAARTIESFEAVTAADLIAEYNLAHVSLFLCLAESVALTFRDLTLNQRRELMRQLKFQRLMADVRTDADDKSLTLSLSGALQLFGKAQVYGLRVANFFRFAASMPRWSLEADVKWKGKKLLLSVDETSGIKTTSKRSGGGYIPEEFEHLLAALRDSGLAAEAGRDFMHVGRQSYCFPDFLVKTDDGEISFELFHPWHKFQLKDRIEACGKTSVTGLVLGVDRSLLKDDEVKKICAESAWFQTYGFEYSQFPTVSAVKKALARK